MSRQLVPPSQHYYDEDDFFNAEDEMEVNTNLFKDLQFPVNFLCGSNNTPNETVYCNTNLRKPSSINTSNILVTSKSVTSPQPSSSTKSNSNYHNYNSSSIEDYPDLHPDYLLNSSHAFEEVIIKVEHSDSESVNDTPSSPSPSPNRPTRKCRAKPVNYTELDAGSKKDSSPKNNTKVRDQKAKTRKRVEQSTATGRKQPRRSKKASRESESDDDDVMAEIIEKTDQSLDLKRISRKAAQAARARERRANEPEEARRLRLAKVAARKRERIAQETEEQKAIRRRRDAERHQLARLSELTEEEKAARRLLNEKKYRAHIGTRTDEEKAARRQRDAEKKRARIAEETEEEKAARRLRDAERHRARIAEETEEEKAERRRRDTEKSRARLANETEEQRAARRQRINENERKRRSKWTEEQREKFLAKTRQTLPTSEETKKAQRVRRYMYYVARRYADGEEETQRKNKLISARARERRHNFTPEQKKRYLESVYRSTKKYLNKLKEDPMKWKEKADKLQQKTANETPEKRHKRLYKHKVDQAKRRLRKQLEHEGIPADTIKQRVTELGEEMWANMPPFTNEISQYKPRPRRHRKSPAPARPILFTEEVSSQSNWDDNVDSTPNLFPSQQSVFYHPDANIPVKRDNSEYSNSLQTVQAESPPQLMEPDDSNSNLHVYPLNTNEKDEKKCPTMYLPVVEDLSNDQDENYGSDNYDIQDDYVPPNSPPSPPEVTNECSTEPIQSLSFQTFDVENNLGTCQSAEQTKQVTLEAMSKEPQPVDHNKTVDSTPRKKKRQMCDECGKEYTYIALHKKMVHNPDRPMSKCPHCPQEFKHSSSLWHHFNSVHMLETFVETSTQDSQPQPFKKEETECTNYYPTEQSNLICQACGKTFECMELLNRHFFYMHGRGSKRERSVCPHCATSYKHAAQLNAHIRQVHEGLHFRCDICNRDCQSDGKLWRHKVEVHKLKDLPAPKTLMECMFCGEKLLRGYEIHVKKHHPDKMEEFLAGNTTTIRYVKLHKMYVKCPECHKEITKGSLTKHLRNTHKIGKVKSFPCSVCNREFKERYHLSEHMRTVHDTILEKIGENKLFYYICQEGKIVTVCRICGGSWGDNFDVRTHLVSQHSNIYKMLEANESIPFKCNECLEELSCEDELRQHTEFNHSEQCDRCPKCSKAMLYWFEKEHHLTQGCHFSLVTTGMGKAKRLLQIRRSREPGRKLVQCSECSKEMKKGSLRRHLSSVHGIGTLKSFPCPTCDHEFKQQSDLTKHIKTQHVPDKVPDKIKPKLKVSDKTSNAKKKRIRKHATEIPKRKSLRVSKSKKYVDCLVSDTEGDKLTGDEDDTIGKKKMKSMESVGKSVPKVSTFEEDNGELFEQTRSEDETSDVDVKFSVSDRSFSCLLNEDARSTTHPQRMQFRYDTKVKESSSKKICAQNGITKSVKIHLAKLTNQDISKYIKSSFLNRGMV